MKIQREIVKEQVLGYQFAKILLKKWVGQLTFKVSKMKVQNLQ
jgi:hypothetical protein